MIASDTIMIGAPAMDVIQVLRNNLSITVTPNTKNACRVKIKSSLGTQINFMATQNTHTEQSRLQTISFHSPLLTTFHQRAASNVSAGEILEKFTHLLIITLPFQKDERFSFLTTSFGKIRPDED